MAIYTDNSHLKQTKHITILILFRLKDCSVSPNHVFMNVQSVIDVYNMGMHMFKTPGETALEHQLRLISYFPL